MKTTITNNIIIENPTEEVLNWCKNNLVLTNPLYTQMKILGREDTIRFKHIPEKLDLVSRRANKIVLPYGTLYAVWKFINQYPYEIKLNEAENLSIINDVPTVQFYDYQTRAVEAMLKAKGGVLVAGCGAGKGLPLNAKIYTPNGWKYNGDLKIGDKIIGSNGKETTVIGIYDKGLVDAYKIKFSDGTETICDKDHLWAVQTCNQRASRSKKFFTIKSEDIFKMDLKNQPRMRNGLFIPIVEPVHFKSKNIPINAWLFGLLLADGCFSNHNISISIAEKDILERVKKITNLKQNTKYDYNIRDDAYILNEIRKLNLGFKHSYEKFIPDIYKYNDIETRLSVLQGLIDGDGTVDCQKKHIEYTTTSYKLALDIKEIVESLGGIVSIRERKTNYTYKGLKKEGRTSYRLHIKIYKFIPFSSEKHLKNYKARTKYNRAYRKIIDVEKIEPIVSRCIKVSAKDELYVIDNFVVTHNTFMGTELIKRVGKKTLWLCLTGDLLRQARDDMKEIYPNIKLGLTTEGKLEIGEDVTISTVQTLINIDPDLYKNEFGMVIVDECAHVASAPTQMKMLGKVLSNIPARYKYGLTATPSRSDGMIKAMYSYIGVSQSGLFAPTYQVDKKDVNTLTAKHQKVELNTGYDEEDMYKIYDTSGMIVYNDLITSLSTNEKRNKLVVDNIVKCAEEGRKQVVLALRVEHCEQLVEMLKNKGIKAVLCVGKTKAKDREAILKQQVDWDVIVATYSLLKEGVSVKALDTLHMVVPVADKGMVVQCAGRIERYLENKKEPIVYDYVDVDIPYCEKCYKKRKTALRMRF